MESVHLGEDGMHDGLRYISHLSILSPFRLIVGQQPRASTSVLDVQAKIQNPIDTC